MAGARSPVPCACGRTHHVEGTDAGREVPCGCGRVVTIPSLVGLKASIGEPALSPDLELTHLISARALPVESACVCCGRDTEHTIALHVLCESATTRDGHMPLWQKILVFVFFRVFVIRAQTERAGSFGRDVEFRLPCRVCEARARYVTGSAAIRQVLARTPVYDRLLTKYPHALVSRAG